LSWFDLDVKHRLSRRVHASHRPSFSPHQLDMAVALAMQNRLPAATPLLTRQLLVLPMLVLLGPLLTEARLREPAMPDNTTNASTTTNASAMPDNSTTGLDNDTEALAEALADAFENVMERVINKTLDYLAHHNATGDSEDLDFHDHFGYSWAYWLIFATLVCFGFFCCRYFCLVLGRRLKAANATARPQTEGGAAQSASVSKAGSKPIMS